MYAPQVVSYRNSTSNHNEAGGRYVIATLYLIEILHQTTTAGASQARTLCCILSKFYIKPQLRSCNKRTQYVVSYRNSTSNHNNVAAGFVPAWLYLIEILHQTTTRLVRNSLILSCILSKFYIKPQHSRSPSIVDTCCILSKFYIKPQPSHPFCRERSVVSYRNSTSNHNSVLYGLYVLSVVSYRNSTSNHNKKSKEGARLCVVSYRNSTSNHNMYLPDWFRELVVSYRNSTSNHNYRGFVPILLYVVSYRNSTSNHNSTVQHRKHQQVVSYRNSTSNHNERTGGIASTRVVSYRNSTSNHNVGPHID